MIFAAITHLRAAENPPKKAPSYRWYQTFMKSHQGLFRTINIEPIALKSSSAQDVAEVQNWLNWAAFCGEKCSECPYDSSPHHLRTFVLSQHSEP
jgi:hypothetical protein